MTRPAHSEMDCKNVFPVPLKYDRISELGVPYDNPHWTTYSARDFYDELVKLGERLESLGFFGIPGDRVKAVLTAGIYVDKPGYHGQGRGFDFDGFMMEDNTIHVYRPDVDKVVDGYTIKSMNRVLACRIAATIAHHFGLVLTWEYNLRHIDHIHFDTMYPVGWRKPNPHSKQSQIVMLQELLVHCYGFDLVVDGKFGPLTRAAFFKAMDCSQDDNPGLDIMWLKIIHDVSDGSFNK